MLWDWGKWGQDSAIQRSLGHVLSQPSASIPPSDDPSFTTLTARKQQPGVNGQVHVIHVRRRQSGMEAQGWGLPGHAKGRTGQGHWHSLGMGRRTSGMRISTRPWYSILSQSFVHLSTGSYLDRITRQLLGRRFSASSCLGAGGGEHTGQSESGTIPQHSGLLV